MVDMECVRQFNNELSTIYETKPPVSKGKVASITRFAVKAIKYYKHVVQSVEKFSQKCRQEYKVPALYIIDSIIRQSRHQFGADKDVFGPRFGKGIVTTFQHLFKCPPEDQGKIVKVLNLWQKGGVFPPDVVQPLLNMAQQNQNEEPSLSMNTTLAIPTAIQPQETQSSLPGNGAFVSVLQQQQQQHLEQIEHLRRQLQEQQSINQQQQQQLAQQRGQPVDPSIGGPMDNQPIQFPGHQVSQSAPPQVPDVLQTPQSVLQGGASGEGGADQPRFQLQPHVLAQIQALTGMNIRLPQPAPNHHEPPQNQQPTPVVVPGTVQALDDQGTGAWGHPGPGSHVPLTEGPPQPSNRKEQNMLDDFDYGDEQDDATRLAEQRRHLMEEEQRLSQELMSIDKDRHGDRSPRKRSSSPHSRRNRSPRRRSRSPRRRSRSPRSSRDKRDRSRDRERGRDRDRGRDREEAEREKEDRGPPPIVKDACSVCSSTIWVGHLTKSVQQNDLQEVFAVYGEVISIDLIPPRGCAYVQMAKREDASKAVGRLANLRLHGNFVKLAWAPAKGVKDRKYKEYFNVDLGVTYIPWEVLGSVPDLQALAEGGWIDPNSLPTELQNSLKAAESQGEKDAEGKKDEAANPLANQGLLPQIPTHLPPPGHPMFNPMMPPPMMLRAPFPGGPNMLPPEGSPWGLNMQAGPPPGFNPAVPPPQGIRPPLGGAAFPFHQTGDTPTPFHPRLPMGLPPHGQEPGGMPQFRSRFPLDHPHSGTPGGPRPMGTNGPRRDFEEHHTLGEGTPRNFENPPRGFGGPRASLLGPPPHLQDGGPQRGPDPHHIRPNVARGSEAPHIRHEGPRFDSLPRGPEGLPIRPPFDGPPRGPEGPLVRHEGPRCDGPPKEAEGPERPAPFENPSNVAPKKLEESNRTDGPPHVPTRDEGPSDLPQGEPDRVDVPPARFDGQQRGPPMNLEGPRGPSRPWMDGQHSGPGGPPRGPEFRGGPHGRPPLRPWGAPLERPMGVPPAVRMPHPEWQRGPQPERMQEERLPLERNFGSDQPPPSRDLQRPGERKEDGEYGQRFKREREERPSWERDRDRRRDRDRPKSRDRDRHRSRDRDTSRDRESRDSRDSDRDRHDRNYNRRDHDRRDRDRDMRDRDIRDRDRRDRDRRRSYSDRDSRGSSDGEKPDRQMKPEPSQSSDSQSEKEKSSNELSISAIADAPVVENNQLTEPEEGELIEGNNAMTSPNEDIKPKIEDLTDNNIETTSTKIEELKSVVEEDKNVALDKTVVDDKPELNNQMLQHIKTEPAETS